MCSFPLAQTEQPADVEDDNVNDRGSIRRRAGTVYAGIQMFPLKDQAPKIFSDFRSMWGIDDDVYLERICSSSDCLKPLGSQGKSGAFFYISKYARISLSHFLT